MMTVKKLFVLRIKIYKEVKNNKAYKKRLLLEKYPLSKEDLFFGITNDLEIKIDNEKYPDYIFYFNGDNKSVFHYNFKSGDFYCSHSLYWLIFEGEYGLNYGDIQSFTKNMVEKHFKLEEITPEKLNSIPAVLVEEHFKLKEVHHKCEKDKDLQEHEEK